MASEEPKDVNIYFVKGYTKCHVVLLALDKHRLSEYDIMNLAGHAKFETTRQFYLAVREDLLRDACAVSAEAMNGDFVAHLLRTPFCA